jgi:septum formation protein
MIRVPVTLASQSAIRASVLRAAGVVVSTVSPGVDEDQVKAELAGQSVKAIAQALADRKALAVQASGLVIGADQALEFEGRLYDKAKDVAEARERLCMLRGKTHQLHAGVTVARDGEVIWRETTTSTLTMRTFSDAFLDAYLVENGGALSSVGCYQLEGEGAQLFSRIEGDYFAILGMPLLGLLELLRREGALSA